MKYFIYLFLKVQSKTYLNVLNNALRLLIKPFDKCSAMLPWWVSMRLLPTSMAKTIGV